MEVKLIDQPQKGGSKLLKCSETHAKKNSEGGILGCLGRPTPPPGGSCGGRKTIRFFL